MAGLLATAGRAFAFLAGGFFAALFFLAGFAAGFLVGFLLAIWVLFIVAQTYRGYLASLIDRMLGRIPSMGNLVNITIFMVKAVVVNYASNSLFITNTEMPTVHPMFKIQQTMTAHQEHGTLR